MVWVSPRLRLCANKFDLQSNSYATFKIAYRVAGFISALLFKALETVEGATPRDFAISIIVV